LQLSGTDINATNSPIGAITAQSTVPSFVNRNVNGLFGLAYPYLSKFTELDKPRTVMDSWVKSKGMKNQIGFKFCPYVFIYFN
jgi:hypothetical protein